MIPTTQSNDPIPIFRVNFSFNSKVEEIIIAKKDKVMAIG